MPLTNAVSTVVSYAHAGNVDTVLIAGEIRKWRGQLVGHDLAKFVSGCGSRAMTCSPVAAKSSTSWPSSHRPSLRRDQIRSLLRDPIAVETEHKEANGR